ncbi:MAG: hypothetical protein WB992_23205 [Bryobacteraceae bacterium]
MALFTDAYVITLADLLPFESSLVQVASSHAIDVDTKINLSISAIGDELMRWLLNSQASDPQWLNRRVLGLSTVVVTPPLHRWVCFDSLSRFFAEAYNVQLNTRFQGKWTEYQQQAADAANLAFMSDIGLVYNPLPKPAMPILSVATGNIPAQAVFVQTAWTDVNGNESALSPANGVILAGSSSLSVAVKPHGIHRPTAAVGWNVYASNTENTLTRQNAAPLPGYELWNFPGTGLITGPAALNGQLPSVYLALARQIQRG